MADAKVSGLSALGAAPATNDQLVLVDVSDTTMAGTGTDKNMTVANLFTSPSLTTPTLGAATGTSLVLSSFLNEAKGADIASSGTTDIGAATGNFVHVTGTTTITALGTIQAGTRRVVKFTGALTLTHNATSLILPSSANITTVAGDTAEFISLGSGNWICTDYQKVTWTGSGSQVLATSPTLTTAVLGSSTATTQTAGDASTKVATTAYVDNPWGAWTAWTPTVTQGGGSIALTSNNSRYTQVNKLVVGIFRFVVSGSGSAGSTLRFSTPVTNFQNGATINVQVGTCNWFDTSATLRYRFLMQIISDSSLFQMFRTDDTANTEAGVAPNVGVASGDVIVGTFVYESS